MKTYKTLGAAIKGMPSCLSGSRCDDSLAIEMQGRRDAENPLAILRDLVRIELDLIHEGKFTTGRCRKFGFGIIGTGYWPLAERY